MMVFIDESGTNKQDGRSAFALVYVAVKNYESFSRSVVEIEKDLKINFFHWAKNAPPVRAKLARLEFEAKVAVIRNPSFPDKEIERLLPHMLIEKNIRSITLDGEKPTRYRRKLKKILRDSGVTTKKLRTASDESSAGVRVADAIAGLTRAYYDQKGGRVVRESFERLRGKRKISLIFE